MAAIGVAGIGRILLWQGGSLWIGRGAGHSRPHSHHAIQVTVALDAPERGILLRDTPRDPWRTYEAAMVRPHHRHEFDGCGGSVAHIFLEPETVHGRALLARMVAGVTSLAAAGIAGSIANLRRRWRSGKGDDEALVAASRAVIEELCGPAPPHSATTPRMAAAVAFIGRRLASEVSLADVAAAVHLSPSRLRHLFVAELGTTFRGYVLWRRILVAVAAMMAGRSWTEAAHEAGFADSAHLSRTFRRTFGISPRMLVKE